MDGRMVTRAELRHLIGSSIGWARATEILAALTCHLPPAAEWPLGEVIAELEVIAKGHGLAGAVARFARATLLLDRADHGTVPTQAHPLTA